MPRKTSQALSFEALPVTQGKHVFYFFRAPASTLKGLFDVQIRDEHEDDGYQRHFAPARVRSITNYVKAGHAIPSTILVSLESGEYSNGRIHFPKRRQIGWIIDGQHRFLGAVEAGGPYQLPFLAFVDLDINEQVNQFVVINREARGVPTSLYYDLLPKLRDKRTPAVAAKERAADIGNQLRKDEDSEFFGKIVVTQAPGKGQLSLNNFVRKIYPLLIRDKGILGTYTEQQQLQVIDNYFRGLGRVFPKEYRKTNSKFFQTLGFGALINALPTFLSTCLGHYGKFRPRDVAAAFREIKHFDFDAWSGQGTGTVAEKAAGDDLIAELNTAFESLDSAGGTLVLE